MEDNGYFLGEKKLTNESVDSKIKTYLTFKEDFTTKEGNTVYLKYQDESNLDEKLEIYIQDTFKEFNNSHVNIFITKYDEEISICVHGRERYIAHDKKLAEELNNSPIWESVKSHFTNECREYFNMDKKDFLLQK